MKPTRLVVTCVFLSLAMISSSCAKPTKNASGSKASPGANGVLASPDVKNANGDAVSRTKPKPGRSAKPGSATSKNGSPGPLQTPVPYASDPHNERVTWDEAKAWWPYRPLLRYDDSKPPRPGGREVLYVTSKEGGRKGNPRKNFTAVTAFWEVPPNTTDKVAYYGVTGGGGMNVSARFYPPTIPPGAANGGKKVFVRGFPASLLETRKDIKPEDENEWQLFGTENIRYIQWQDQLPNDAGLVDWLAITDPTVYTEQQAIEALNAMIEVR